MIFLGLTHITFNSLNMISAATASIPSPYPQSLSLELFPRAKAVMTYYREVGIS